MAKNTRSPKLGPKFLLHFTSSTKIRLSQRFSVTLVYYFSKIHGRDNHELQICSAHKFDCFRFFSPIYFTERCELYSLSAERLREVLQKHPEVAKEVPMRTRNAMSNPSSHEKTEGGLEVPKPHACVPRALPLFIHVLELKL